MGFIAGSLIGGVFFEYGLLVQFLFLVLGLAVLGDTIFTSQFQTYIVSAIIFVVIGFILSLVFYAAGVGLYYIILILILMVISYGFRFMIHKGSD